MASFFWVQMLMDVVCATLTGGGTDANAHRFHVGAKSRHRRPPVARRSTSCAVLALGHWQVSRCFLKGEAGCSYLDSVREEGGAGQPSEKRAALSMAPPPSPLH